MLAEEVERMGTEGRWMSAELSERDKDTDKQERRERIRESREMHDRGCSGVLGERESEREKIDGKIQMWERREKERTGIGRKKKREGAGCAARRERRSSTCGADAAK
jgi:hypothetical protein